MNDKCDNKLFINKIWVHLFSIIIILIFSIISGLSLLVDPKTTIFVRVSSFIVVLSAIFLGCFRDTYLPFLGNSIIPLTSFVSEKIPDGANISYILNTKDYPNGTRVFYWGAKSTNKNTIQSNPIKAYGDYNNSGVSIVNNGKAVLKFFCPDKYSINYIKGTFLKNNIERHLHYRIECPDSGFLSSVKTIKVECN